MSLLIVGCGYVGKAVAVQYLRDHQTVYALTRSQQTADQLFSLGIKPLVGHWLQRESLPNLLSPIDELLVAVPHRPDEFSPLAEDSDQQHVLGLSNLMNWLASYQPLPTLVYLSTTGVFGATTSGQRVNEQTEIAPTRLGPRIAAAAEKWLNEHRSQWHSVVLRLAGIYGPGRIPMLSALQQGQPLAVAKDGTLNLIHLDDIVQAILWAMRTPDADALYVVADGQPASRKQFYSCLARLLCLPPPTFTNPDPHSSRAARASDKQVDPRRFWSHSQLKPVYPSYQEGLRSLPEVSA